jgi:hypothetical protein
MKKPELPDYNSMPLLDPVELCRQKACYTYRGWVPSLEQRVVTPEEYVQRLVEKQFSWGDDD